MIQNNVFFDKKSLQENALEVNDAQYVFDRFLSTFSKKSREIFLNMKMHGLLNLGQLKDFPNIKTIYLGKNHVVGLRNIPKGIERLECSQNLLRDVGELPESLKILNLKQNALEKIDLSKTKELESLNVSFNHLESLTSLPESLKVLKCDHNQLSELDLQNCIHLEVLYCHNNPDLRLKHIPDTLIDSKFPKAFLHEDSRTENNIVTHHGPSDKYKDELNKYFEIKSKYEKKQKELRENKNNTTFPKCYGCGKNVGMFFSNKNRKYQVRCGGNPPCNWNLVISRGQFIPREEVLYTYYHDVEELKEKIIQQKMATLYHHMSDQNTAELFEQQLSAYESAKKYLDELLQDEKNMYSSDRKMELMDETEYQINEQLQVVKEFLKDRNIEEAVEVQYKKIRPLSQKIQRLQYEKMRMIEFVNHSDAKVFLLQEEVGPEKLEMNVDHV